MTPQPAQSDPNRDAFAAQKETLIQAHEGKFALFHNGALDGVFDTMDAAYAEGVRKFGLEPIYIGHLVEVPPSQSAPALQHGLINARP